MALDASEYGLDPATVAARRAERSEFDALVSKQTTPATDDPIELEAIRRAYLDEATKGPAQLTKNVEARARAEAITRRITALKQATAAKALADGKQATATARLEAARSAKLQAFVNNGGTPAEFDGLWQQRLKVETANELATAELDGQAQARDRKRAEYSGVF
jgi:hypothetical protein